MGNYYIETKIDFRVHERILEEQIGQFPITIVVCVELVKPCPHNNASISAVINKWNIFY